MYIHLEQDDKTDPRILRTRELLINSFAKLLIEQNSIRRVSVQSVTKLAGVNRVTFYAHFTDKYDLLDTWARIMFRQSVTEKLPKEADFSEQNLKLLVNGTLNFFTERSKHRRRINEEFESMFETAIQQELKALLISMLENTQNYAEQFNIEYTATFLSWSIFGCASDLCHAGNQQPKDKIAKELVSAARKVVNL